MEPRAKSFGGTAKPRYFILPFLLGFIGVATWHNQQMLSTTHLNGSACATAGDLIEPIRFISVAGLYHTGTTVCIIMHDVQNNDLQIVHTLSHYRLVSTYHIHNRTCGIQSIWTLRMASPHRGVLSWEHIPVAFLLVACLCWVTFQLIWTLVIRQE